MAGYTNLTLDTTAPSSVSVIINNEEIKTNSAEVTLSITCSDEDLKGYQMKIWGTSSAETEDSASWENFQNTKNITLPAGDGGKTVFVKVRDDVWNESVTVSDTIMLQTKLPSVLDLVLFNSKISLVSGRNMSTGIFEIDESISALKIMIVQNINAAYNDPTNISIPTKYGSYMESDLGRIPNASSDVLEADETMVESVYSLNFTLCADDIQTASPGDGVKIIKIFVKSAESGNWSL